MQTTTPPKNVLTRFLRWLVSNPSSAGPEGLKAVVYPVFATFLRALDPPSRSQAEAHLAAVPGSYELFAVYTTPESFAEAAEFLRDLPAGVKSIGARMENGGLVYLRGHFASPNSFQDVARGFRAISASICTCSKDPLVVASVAWTVLKRAVAQGGLLEHRYEHAAEEIARIAETSGIWREQPEGSGTDFEPDTRVLDLGRELNAEGGIKLMRAIAHRVDYILGYECRDLEGAWDGIGEWIA